MSAEVGQFALILALLLALVQSAAPLVGASRGDNVLMALGRQAALLPGSRFLELPEALRTNPAAGRPAR